MRKINRLRAGVIRAMGLAVLIWAVYIAADAPPDATLDVRIVDGATGEPVPAMVCITSLADGLWRTPPDGHVSPPYSTTRDFYEPGPWEPGRIGPVRLTNGEYHDNEKRSTSYKGGPVSPYWKEPAAYFVPRPFTIKLVPGKWRLAVARGIEYLPLFEEFTLAPGEQRQRKVVMKRWVDMPSRGWYSGDGHVHFPRLTRQQDEFLLTWARAEDVHLVNVLRMGDLGSTYFEQRGYGRDFRAQSGDYVLVTGQEDPRTTLGHTIAWNLTAPVRDTSRYYVYDTMFDGAHAQGALAGWAHASWPNLLLPVDAIRGKLDFFEILQFRALGLDHYYRFLNLGATPAAAAGSDLPWGNTMGEVRTYAYTGRSFSADAWFDAVKRGRTFVSNGPMLEFTVNGEMPGARIEPRQNGPLHIRARAWAPEATGTPARLEIVSNGSVIRSAEAAGAVRQQLRLDFTIRAESSQWLAARVTTTTGGLAHSSSVYVYPDGRRFWNRPDLPADVRYQLTALDNLETRVAVMNEKSPLPGLAEMRQRITAARQAYRHLLDAQ